MDRYSKGRGKSGNLVWKKNASPGTSTSRGRGEKQHSQQSCSDDPFQENYSVTEDGQSSRRGGGNLMWKKNPSHGTSTGRWGRRGKYHGQQSYCDDSFQESHLVTENIQSSRGGKIRPPPHLRGKEIGLFYAKISQENRKVREEKLHQVAPILKLEDSEVIGIQDQLRGCATPSASAGAGEDWKTKYSGVDDSHFKAKFMANLIGNDSTHFASSEESVKSTFLPIPEMDNNFLEELTSKSSLKEYQEMLQVRSKLPITSYCDQILKCVEGNQVIVICGETGCGKTTQVGQFLLDHALKSGKGSTFHAICTQPRRIAAISVAERVAQERCEPCGNSVGYQ